MSPSTKASIRNVAALFGGIAAFAVAYQGLVQIVRVDALARFRPKGDVTNQDQGILVKDFEFKSYSGNKIQGQARVENLIVRKDRSTFQMFAVTDGKYYADNGQSFAFTADEATYGYFSKSLLAERGARVKNKDLDLKVPKFLYAQNQQLLTVEDAIEGKFYGGKIKANLLRYNVAQNTYTTAEIMWQGQPQDATIPSKRMWEIRGKTSLTQNDVMTATEARATDGEIIIKADKVVWERKTDILTATGNVRYYGLEANLTCAKVVVYRKEARAVLSGKVDMFVKPEEGQKLEEVEIPPLTPFVPEEIAKLRPGAPKVDDKTKQQDRELRDPDTFRRYPAQITADTIEYWYRRGQRRAILSGSPQARQELGPGRWRMAWANQAFYDGEADRLKLASRDGQKDARIMTSIGDDLRARMFEVSTRRGDDYQYAEEVEGVTYVDDDEIPPPPGRTGGTTGGGGGGGQPTIRGPIGKKR